MRLASPFLICSHDQVAGDGCSERCQCETDPCDFAANPSVNLASVVVALRPGATLSLAAGTCTGSGSCGWSIATTVSSADDRSLPITVRGAQGATIIDCDNVAPVVEDTILGAHLRLEGIHFTQSQRSGGSGGVLRAEQGSEIVIDNCRFTHCACDGYGGAIYVSNSSITVVRSHFEENRFSYPHDARTHAYTHAHTHKGTHTHTHTHTP